ncbi:MAG: hypothetical protein QF541_12130 [Lentisphaeria bacterium]|nr:hypothetical protein [Lentisphaeria bacterium]
MNLPNINLDNIKEWLRHDWEKGIFMVVFAIAAIAVLFAVREINRWKVEAAPVRPGRHISNKMFPDGAFTFLFPQQLAHIDLQDDHALTFHAPNLPILVMPNLDVDGEYEDVVPVIEPIDVPFIRPSVEAEYPPESVVTDAETNPIIIDLFERLESLEDGSEVMPPDDDEDDEAPEDEDGTEPKYVEFKGIMVTPKGKRLAYLCVEAIIPEPGAGMGGGLGDMGMGGGFGDMGMGDMGMGGMGDMGMGGMGGMGDMGMGGAPGPPPPPPRDCKFIEEGTNFDIYLIKKVTRKEVIVEDKAGNEIPIALRSRVELSMSITLEEPPLADTDANVEVAP